MKGRFLEITYRAGKPMAAYRYLPRRPNDRSVSTRRLDPALVIDLAEDGQAIGMEIASPSVTTIADLNRALAEVKQPELLPEEAAPLLRAA